MRAAVSAVLAVTALALAGPTLGAPQAAVPDRAPGAGQAGIPANLDIQSVDQKEAGRWRIVDDTVAGAAIEHSASTSPTSRDPLAIYKASASKNFDISLRFKMLASRDEQAGVALRLLASDDYDLVQADARRGRVAFLRVTKDLVAEIASVEADVFGHQWRTLKVRAQGEQFTIWLDGVWLFTAYDHAESRSGRVALWTTPESISRFAAIEVVPLPTSDAR